MISSTKEEEEAAKKKAEEAAAKKKAEEEAAKKNAEQEAAAAAAAAADAAAAAAASAKKAEEEAVRNKAKEAAAKSRAEEEAAAKEEEEAAAKRKAEEAAAAKTKKEDEAPKKKVDEFLTQTGPVCSLKPVYERCDMCAYTLFRNTRSMAMQVPTQPQLDAQELLGLYDKIGQSKKMGIKYAGNTITDVNVGQQAEREGVCKGWRIGNVCCMFGIGPYTS